MEKSGHACKRCDAVLLDGRRRLCVECDRTHRWCNQCSTVKPRDEFYGIDGPRLTRYCKACHMAHIRRPDRVGALQEYHYRYHLRAKFGISAAEADALADVERCQACGSAKTERRLHVDHDHATGEIRGVLCRTCNFALGFLEDHARVQAIRGYLDRCDQRKRAA